MKYVIVPAGPARVLAPHEDFLEHVRADLSGWRERHFFSDERPEVWISHPDAEVVARQPRVRVTVAFMRPEAVVEPGLPGYLYGARLRVQAGVQPRGEGPPPDRTQEARRG